MTASTIDGLKLVNKAKQFKQFLLDEKIMRNEFDSFNIHNGGLAAKNDALKNKNEIGAGVYVVFIGETNLLMNFFQFAHHLKMNSLFGLLDYIVRENIQMEVYVGYSCSDWALAQEISAEVAYPLFNRTASSRIKGNLFHLYFFFMIFNLFFFVLRSLFFLFLF